MRFTRTWLIVLIFCGTVVARAQESDYIVTMFGAFTTSSKLFPHPNAVDEFTRGQFLSLDDIFSAGVELRRELPAFRVQIGLSVEYISKSELINVPDSLITIPVRDGFKAFPIELTGYFIIQFSGERIKLSMGAGAGVYPGIRTYDYANAQAALVGRSTGVGIHVVSGIEYTINDLFSLRSVIKFRDVQFESVNRFIQATTLYNGTPVGLSQDPLSSRINIDGMVTTLGISIRF